MKRNNTIYRVNLVALLSALLTVGCASQKTIKNTEMVDQSRIELSESAIAVNHSLQTMASIEQSKSPIQVQESRPNPTTYGMGHIASVDWVGPVEPLVKKLATMAQYRFTVIGNPPSIPVMVTINEHDVAIGEILQNALLQTRSQVDVQVYPDSELIELRYL